jgi:hypothetical protein
MSGELVRIWKEAVMAHLKLYSVIRMNESVQDIL